MNIDLASIGLTQEELQDRVVAALAHNLLTTVRFNMNPDIDPDTDEGYEENSLLKRKLDAEVMKRIDEAITHIGETQVKPLITSIVEGHVIQTTNIYGEKKGEPKSFTEYMIERADAYVREPVDYNGKARGESGSSYDWKQKSTRIAWMVDKHLQYSIENAMARAVADVNSSVIGGLKEAVNVALSNITVTAKTEVKTK